jgi:hypothetical protein
MYQFQYSKVPMLSMVDGAVVIGASGAVSSSSGALVYAVVRETTGIYSIQCSQNFNRVIGASFSIYGGVTGSTVNDGSLVVGTPYQIQTVGTTSWTSVGLKSGLTAAVGQHFVAGASGGAGTGVVKAIGLSGIDSVELMRSENTMLASSIQGQGALVYFQTLNASGALANPASGCEIRFMLQFSNSSVSF